MRQSSDTLCSRRRADSLISPRALRSGIVSVSAKDLATNEEQSIQVNPRGTLSQEEIEKIASEFDTGEVAVKG